MSKIPTDEAILVLQSLKFLVPAMWSSIKDGTNLPENIVDLLFRLDSSKADEIGEAIDLAIYSIQSIDQIMESLDYMNDKDKSSD